MSLSDGRGSKHQKHIYDLLRKIYPAYSIIYEQNIECMNLRIDLLVKELGIAVEYDGQQHDEYVDFFHKDLIGYEESKFRDNKKEEFLRDNAIKLIRINGDATKLSTEDLKGIIEEVEYPEGDYDFNCFKEEDKYLIKQRLLRKKRNKKQYNRMKLSK